MQYLCKYNGSASSKVNYDKHLGPAAAHIKAIHELAQCLNCWREWAVMGWTWLGSHIKPSNSSLGVSLSCAPCPLPTCSFTT